MLKTATCQNCNRQYPTIEMVKTSLAKRGGANAYMCRACATTNEQYHATNTKDRGRTKASLLRVGIELETSYSDEHARNTLFAYGLIPTHDCSLRSEGAGSKYGYDENTCEYVTGILEGLNIPSKLCQTVDNLMTDNHLSINDSCGTHFHVSVNNMNDENGRPVYMGYIRRFYNSLFVPLTEAMKANPAKTSAVFGRYFTDYAKEITKHSTTCNHSDRYYFINCINNNNIEFRLNKFTSARQYQNLMKMEAEMVQCIIKNFCEHFNDSNLDQRRYADEICPLTGEVQMNGITKYRKHKAQMTAKKIVKIFEKYASNI